MCEAIRDGSMDRNTAITLLSAMMGSVPRHTFKVSVNLLE